jgi:excisionase family DNA binding protein
MAISRKKLETRESARPAVRVAERVMGRPVNLKEACQIMKVPEAAEFLAVDVSTLRTMTYRREIPHFKTGKRGVGYLSRL